jgi:acyl dehydratase
MTTPSPSPHRWWEDFTVDLQVESAPIEVTREEILAFASRYDPQPFHLDEEAARQSLFGGLVASGWMTAGLTMRLMCESYLLNSSSLGSPGLESLRWLKPVRPGDRLRMRMTVLDRRPMNSRPDVGLVLARMDTLNQRDEVVMTMEGWGMYRRRPETDALKA